MTNEADTGDGKMKQEFYSKEEALKAHEEMTEEVKKRTLLSVIQLTIMRTFNIHWKEVLTIGDILKRVYPFPANAIEIKNEAGILVELGLLVLVDNQPEWKLALSERGAAELEKRPFEGKTNH